MQQQFPLVGNVIRPLALHTEAEIRSCHTKGQACRVALVHSGFCQEVIAERINVTPGYLSMLLSGKRRWTDDVQRRFIRVTGSLAPLQWDAMQEGVDIYVDPIKVKRAAAMAVIAECDREDRAA